MYLNFKFLETQKLKTPTERAQRVDEKNQVTLHLSGYHVCLLPEL